MSKFYSFIVYVIIIFAVLSTWKSFKISKNENMYPFGPHNNNYVYFKS